MSEENKLYNFENQDKLPSFNVHLLERRITCITVVDLIEVIRIACAESKKITVANYNVHSFNLSMQLPWFYNFLQTAEIAHCDSIGILKAIRFMGLKLPIKYRTSYTILMPKLLEYCNQHRISIFLLGSKPQYLEAALARLKEQYPNICFAGHHGYFAMEDVAQNESVIQQINQSKSQILVMGMGMPIQENWIRLHRNRLNVNVMMLGGAIIDRLAGAVSDCPKFISDLGWEWLYRLCREPKRLAARYLLGNPAFVFHIALAKFYASPLKVETVQTVSSSSLEAKDNLGNLSLNSTTTNESATAHTTIKRIGDYLVEAGLLTQAHVENALSEQNITGMRLGEIIVRKGWLKQQTIEYIMKKLVIPDRSMPRESLFVYADNSVTNNKPSCVVKEPLIL